MRSTLPEVLGSANVFGLPEGTPAVSVAHGWMALVNPLTPGRHTVSISGPTPATTIITVAPGR